METDAKLALVVQVGVQKSESHASSLQTILALGFTAEQAQRALKNNDGNIERAVNWLLQ